MKKRVLALALAALLATALCGCGARGASSGMVAAQEAAADWYDGTYEEADYWQAAPEEAAVPDPMPPQESGSGETDPAKIIYTATLEMETLEFDDAWGKLSALTSACGGYYETSSVTERSGGYRYASVTVRVPAARYRAFIDQAGELCHVLNRSEYAEDVSESYYDTAGRLETQRTKLARLQQLLKSAESMEDIIELENAISNTEETIDRLSGELRHYDALVDYSTVTVYLTEVKVYEEAPPETFGNRLGAAFSDGWNGFVGGLGNILVALAYSWLWLILIAAIVIVVIRLVKRYRAKHPKKPRPAPVQVRYSAPTQPRDDADGKSDET